MDDALTHLRRELAGRYEVEQELGHGGMAVVYLARDLRHDRRVGIKVLRADLGAGSAERFLREIRTVAQLHHPHILALHDSGSAGDQPFYVMPYVEGETLRQRLERTGPLPIDEAVRIAREVADALEYAHARGVVHRDIKPENIFLSAGHALVGDFGIARAADAAGLRFTTLTEAGLAVGTPAYMSPEQATADPKVDGRSDQYALGCVLYEMLAGAPPFTGPTSQAIMARHTSDAVPPLHTVRAIPPSLESAITRALAKVPADRWPDTRVFGEALTSSVTMVSGQNTAPNSNASRRKQAGLVATVVLVLAAAGLAWRMAATRRPEADSITSLALRPFQFDGDTTYSYLADAFAEQLSLGLIGVEGISIKDPGRFPSDPTRLEDPVEIGRQLNVAAVLTGKVTARGNVFRVSPRLLKTADGTVLWQHSLSGELEVEGEPRDIFRAVDSLALEVVAALRPELSAAGRSAAARGVRTTDLDALGLYLQARRRYWALTQENNDAAIGLLRRATERDSNYADAWAALSEATGSIAIWRDPSQAEQELAQRAFDRAIALDSLNGFVLSQRAWRRADLGDWNGAWEDMRKAARLTPASFDVAVNYGGFLRFVGQPESALVHFQRAVGNDPSNAVAWQSLGHVYSLLGKRDSAMAVARRALALDSALWYAHMDVADLEFEAGRRSAADSAVERALRYGSNEAPALAMVARYYAGAGDHGRARELAQRVESMARARRVQPVAVADARLAIGDVDGAFAVITPAPAFQRAIFLIRHLGRLERDPRFEALRRVTFGDRAVPRYREF